MTGFLTALQSVGTFLGAWTLVSTATAIVVIPWFRAMAHANDVLTRSGRAADWEGAVQHGAAREFSAR